MTDNPKAAERLALSLARQLAGHFAARSVPTWETIHAAARELREVNALHATIADLERRLAEAQREYEALTRAARAHLSHPDISSATATLQGRVQQAERLFAAPPPPVAEASGEAGYSDEITAEHIAALNAIVPDSDFASYREAAPQPTTDHTERAREYVRLGCSTGDFGIYNPCRWPDCVCEEVPKGTQAVATAAERAGAEKMRERCKRIANVAADLYDERLGGFESGAHRVARQIANDIEGTEG